MTAIISRTLIFSLTFLITATCSLAELKDGEAVPDRPKDDEKARYWTITGEKRYYLPTLKEGPGKGYFAYYESRYYRAGITEDGGLEIQMVDRDGKELSEKFQLGGSISGRYDHRNENRRHYHVPRYMVGVENADELEPEEQPRDKITIDALLEEGVEFRRTYEFDREEITIVTGLDCSDDNKKKTEAVMGAWFPALARFEPSVPQKEREKAFEDHYIEMRTYRDDRRKTETFHYAKSDFYRGKTDEIEVWGPWGDDRPLIFKTKDEIMRPWLYSGNCPYQGFQIRIYVPHDTLNSYDYKLEIQFRD